VVLVEVQIETKPQRIGDDNDTLLPHTKTHLLEPSGFTSIDMTRVQTINYSMIVHTRNHSDALLDNNIIDSSLTLIDLSWASDAMRGIIHQLFPLADPAR